MSIKPANFLVAKHVQRIDNFLFSKFKHLNKKYIYRIIRSGEVRVNSKRVKPQDKLKINDIVRLPPQCKLTFKKEVPQSNFVKKFLAEHKIFENKDMLVINKPSGIAVHGGSLQSRNIIDLLRSVFGDIQLVHRLDKETSGCLVLAKNRHTLLTLQKDWVSEVKKIYLVLVYGKIDEEFIAEDPILRLRNKTMHGCVIQSNGKKSFTKFIPCKYYGKHNVSLLEAHPYTGRMHQIRVHLKQSGVPIIGDRRYGDANINSHFASLGFKRMFLHSYQIILPKDVKIVAEIDKVWEELEKFVNI